MTDQTNLEVLRTQASLESAGASSDAILEHIVSLILSLELATSTEMMDIGCGQGELLNRVRVQRDWKLTGCDYTNFSNDERPFNFFQYDCNHDFNESFKTYDLVTASEVIEHLENPRHFMRQLAGILKPGGHLLISTPNIESLTSLLSFCLRGYHSAYGGKSYPAHITPLAAFDLLNIGVETGQLKLQSISYVAKGRMPGLKCHWQDFGFKASKHLSDNIVLHWLKT
jgi:2-polyprenyl-3-methyl-5-hydroxy-6-metoxy-1,4-benzoquinol methylase